MDAGLTSLRITARYAPSGSTGLAALAYAVVFVLPLGVATIAVTAAPRLFQHAGWDLRPLEPVASEEQYLVRYTYRANGGARLGAGGAG